MQGTARPVVASIELFAVRVPFSEIAQRAMALQWSADGAFAAGRLADALAGYQKAADLMIESGYRHGEGVARIGLGGVLLSVGRLAESRANLETALAIEQELRDERFIALVQGRLGAVDLEEGRLPEAMGRFAEAWEVHHKDGEKPFEIAAMLGTTEGATMTRLTRARQALRRLVEPVREQRGGRA